MGISFVNSARGFVNNHFVKSSDNSKGVDLLIHQDGERDDAGMLSQVKKACAAAKALGIEFRKVKIFNTFGNPDISYFGNKYESKPSAKDQLAERQARVDLAKSIFPEAKCYEGGLSNKEVVEKYRKNLLKDRPAIVVDTASLVTLNQAAKEVGSRELGNKLIFTYNGGMNPKEIGDKEEEKKAFHANLEKSGAKALFMEAFTAFGNSNKINKQNTPLTSELNEQLDASLAKRLDEINSDINVREKQLGKMIPLIFSAYEKATPSEKGNILSKVKALLTAANPSLKLDNSDLNATMAVFSETLHCFFKEGSQYDGVKSATEALKGAVVELSENKAEAERPFNIFLGTCMKQFLIADQLVGIAVGEALRGRENGLIGLSQSVKFAGVNGRFTLYKESEDGSIFRLNTEANVKKAHPNVAKDQEKLKKETNMEVKRLLKYVDYCLVEATLGDETLITPAKKEKLLKGEFGTKLAALKTEVQDFLK